MTRQRTRSRRVQRWRRLEDAATRGYQDRRKNELLRRKLDNEMHAGLSCDVVVEKKEARRRLLELVVLIGPPLDFGLATHQLQTCHLNQHEQPLRNSPFRQHIQRYKVHVQIDIVQHSPNRVPYRVVKGSPHGTRMIGIQETTPSLSLRRCAPHSNPQQDYYRYVAHATNIQIRSIVSILSEYMPPPD